jgi:hypothetical protein
MFISALSEDVSVSVTILQSPSRLVLLKLALLAKLTCVYLSKLNFPFKLHLLQTYILVLQTRLALYEF